LVLIGALFDENRVSGRAVHRGARVRDQVRREAREVGCQPLDQRDHRRADFRLVAVFAGVKPLPSVVALERPQEGERARSESGCGRGRDEAARRGGWVTIGISWKLLAVYRPFRSIARRGGWNSPGAARVMLYETVC